MTDAALTCLKQDDLRLFSKGACHVFAVALQRYRPDEQYEICRVVCGEMGAYHVYARIGDWIVDVGGLKRESDYLRWLASRTVEQDWPSRPSPEITSEADLLCQARVDPRRGVVNEWGLFTDPAFVSQAMSRAQALVEESDRYRAALMR
jgi:hypothetical protein